MESPERAHERIVLFTKELGDKAIFAPMFALEDGVTAPSTRSGFGQLYIDSADGDLKIKFGDGTVKTIVVDT